MRVTKLGTARNAIHLTMALKQYKFDQIFDLIEQYNNAKLYLIYGRILFKCTILVCTILFD